MGAMGTLDPRSHGIVLNHRHFERTNFYLVALAVLSILIIFTSSVFAATEIDPYFSIRGTIAEEEDEFTRDTGFITTITPGISVFRRGPRSVLDLRYKLDAVFHGGDDESNDTVVNTLDFLTDYQHVPGKWVSTFQANSRLTNIDPLGRQNLDPEFIDDNNAELRTLGVSTEVKDELTDSIDYRALLFGNYATYADSDDGDDTTGQGLLLDLHNFRSTRKLLWRTELAGGLAKNEIDQTQIDSFNGIVGYRISPNWSPYVGYTRTNIDTLESDEFIDNKVLVGFLWSPNRLNYISIGAGKRDGGDGDSSYRDDTYSFDASSIQRNLTFSASYSDDITIARATVFENILEDSLAILFDRDNEGRSIEKNNITTVGSTSQSISIEPIREKIARVGVTVNGNRTVYRVFIFDRDRSFSSNEPDENVRGLQFDYNYRLSGRDNISFAALAQSTVQLETNDFWNLRANYYRQLARSQTMDFGLGWTEQESTSIANEYKRVYLSARYNVTF